MEFFHRAAEGERKRPARVGVFPGTFNPITVAHLEIARAALAHVEEVVLVLPRNFPHKNYAGASFEDRVTMMRAAVAPERGISVAAADGGLFVEIARECREAYGSNVGLQFLCGRDAAERIVGWDYGRPGAIEEMLRDFGLLVAARGGEYVPPPELRDAVRTLEVCDLDHVSATEVRERIARGEAWEHLAPPAIREMARKMYWRE